MSVKPSNITFCSLFRIKYALIKEKQIHMHTNQNMHVYIFAVNFMDERSCSFHNRFYKLLVNILSTSILLNNIPEARKLSKATPVKHACY